MSPTEQPAEDAMDRMMAQWHRERPDLNLGAMEIFGRLGRLTAHLGPAIDQTFAARGLQRGEYDVMAALRRAGAPYSLTPSALSETLMLSRAGMTNRLDRLETAGLIERRHNQQDRRSMHIDLTPAGLELVNEATTAHVANETQLLSGLTPEQQQLLNELTRILLNRFE
ncbi:MAG: MarR family transcriptional regulator [Nakamurella sp.]